MKPRVLILSHTGELGGAELCMLDIAAHLGDCCQVVLFSDGPLANALADRRVKHRVLSMSGRLLGVSRNLVGLGQLVELPGLLRLAGCVARCAEGFDVIYAGSLKGFVVGALASRAACKPLVWHVHDVLRRADCSAAALQSLLLLARTCATRLVANSQTSREAIVACGVSRARTRVVYNGFDASAYRCVGSDVRDRLRRELGMRDEFVIGVFGRLVPFKGQDVLIRALPLVPSACAIFVGEAIFGTPGYAQQLRALADAMGVAERAQFLGFQKNIPELMQLVDVVVHCPVGPEAFGRVIVEGMLAGRPVVSSAVGGTREIITDGETGLLVRPSDPRGLAEAINRLRSDPDLASRLRRCGSASAEARFSMDRMLSAIDEELCKAAWQTVKGTAEIHP